MQSRIARVVSGVYDWSVSGIDIVSQLGWQTVRDRRDYFMCVLMYKCLNGQGPAFYKISLHLSAMVFLRGHRLLISKPCLSAMLLTFLRNVSGINDLSYGIIYQTTLRIVIL